MLEEQVALGRLQLLRVLLGVRERPQVALELLAHGAFDGDETLLLEQLVEARAHLHLALDVLFGRVHRDLAGELGDELVDDGRRLAQAVALDALPDRVAVRRLELGGEVVVEPLRLACLALADPPAPRRCCLISPCAISSASRSTSSGTSSAPASTIVRPSFVPTTIRSSDVSSQFCCSVGLMTSSPSSRPMRTAPTGPKNGSGESISAADAPLMHRMSCGVTMSAERTVQMTCTSLRKPFGQSGRIGRSIMRAVRVARSLALPLALEEAAGDLARGVHPLLDVDGQREEVGALAGLRPSDCRGEHHRLATADDDCAVRLLRELAGLKGDLLASDLDGDLSLALGRDTHSIVLHSAVLVEGGSLSQLRRWELAQTSAPLGVIRS